MNIIHHKKNSGQALLLSVLAVGGVLLGVSSIAGLLMLYQVRQTNDVVNSTKAFYAADAGTEREIYNLNSEVPNPTFSNGSVVTSTIEISGQNVIIRAQGQAVGAVRAIETTIATAPSSPQSSVQIENFSVTGGITPSPCTDSCSLHTPNADPTQKIGSATPLTISWNTKNAVSCAAASSDGNWSSNNKNEPGTVVDVGEWVPPIQFKLLCDDGAGSTAFQTITIFFTIN